MSIETLEFQAEARQLLNLVVHSIYSNKDIFLRELLSNASDAMDKLRLESLTNSNLGADLSDLHILLSVDKDARTLTIRDNGIGMSRDEVRTLIGTIARSGTAEFLKRLKESQNSAELIGQFGVGFYSAFMVADKVTLETRRAGETGGTRWESAGEGTYTLEDVERESPGTTITLHLKPANPDDEMKDYTDPYVLRGIVKQYSDFLSYPIRMEMPKGDGTELTTLNSMKALWARNPSEVKPEEYTEFYRHITHDHWSEPLQTITMKAEGTNEFQALLFIPAKAPFDLYMRDGRRGIQLYVKRVFIMDRCEELLPEYLRFLRGVVDSHDLSLNVSREILQQDRQVRNIRGALTRKVLSVLADLKKNEPEKWRTFWTEFGPVLKEGLVNDPQHQKQILDLADLPSTHSATELTTLSDYVGRMKEGQDSIFYLTGESRSVLENSPHLEKFREKGLEVLLLTDPVDTVWVEGVPDFDGKKLQSAARGTVEQSEEEKKEVEERSKDLATLLSWLGTKLSDQVKEVRVSTRLTTSPACLVSDTHDPSPAMEKLMKAMGQELPPLKRILEVNPQHPVVKRLHELYEERKDDPVLAETAELLLVQALVAEGGDVPDPAKFSRQLADMLARALH